MRKKIPTGLIKESTVLMRRIRKLPVPNPHMSKLEKSQFFIPVTIGMIRKIRQLGEFSWISLRKFFDFPGVFKKELVKGRPMVRLYKRRGRDFNDLLRNSIHLASLNNDLPACMVVDFGDFYKENKKMFRRKMSRIGEGAYFEFRGEILMDYIIGYFPIYDNNIGDEDVEDREEKYSEEDFSRMEKDIKKVSEIEKSLVGDGLVDKERVMLSGLSYEVVSSIVPAIRESVNRCDLMPKKLNFLEAEYDSIEPNVPMAFLFSPDEKKKGKFITGLKINELQFKDTDLISKHLDESLRVSMMRGGRSFSISELSESTEEYLKRVTDHEMGHVLHFNISENIVEKGNEELKKFLREWEDIIQSYDIHDWADLSEYSTYMIYDDLSPLEYPISMFGVEAFAECYCSYVNGLHDRMPPRALDFFKRILSIKGDFQIKR